MSAQKKAPSDVAERRELFAKRTRDELFRLPGQPRFRTFLLMACLFLCHSLAMSGVLSLVLLSVGFVLCVHTWNTPFDFWYSTPGWPIGNFY
jgi:hypothetical protein